MLKIIRILLALLSIIAITLLFLDFTGTARTLWPWLAKIQLMPAILAGNILAVALIIIGTLLFGRIYCSIICPLGIFQDVINRIRQYVGKKNKRKNRFNYTEAHTKIRLGVFTAFVALVILGLFSALSASIAGLIEPYSAYGRISSGVFAPAYDGINNLLAAWSESQTDNYMFYKVVYAVSVPLIAVAIITLLVIVLFAWTGGRNYCNTICPVGTFLGFISRYSLFKPVIDTNKCINCGKCARNCKSSCIDYKRHTIDYSRCVVCMDCINLCSEGAISYTLRRSQDEERNTSEKVDKGRRGFVTGASVIIGAIGVEAIAKTTDGGLTALKDKKPVKRETRVVPPGAVSIRNLESHCTACQLCVQSCPSHLLKPSLKLDGFMQPSMDFTEGYCHPECTVCSEICPAGAIKSIDTAQKSSIKIGTAIVDLDTCISASEGKNCGNCASRCPVGAIIMVNKTEGDDQSPKIPAVNEAECIGCGSCEYHCPVGSVDGMKATHSAIHVEGVEVHREI